MSIETNTCMSCLKEKSVRRFYYTNSKTGDREYISLCLDCSDGGSPQPVNSGPTNPSVPVLSGHYREDVLDHYDRVAKVAKEWHSVVPLAINNYFDNKDSVPKDEDYRCSCGRSIKPYLSYDVRGTNEGVFTYATWDCHCGRNLSFTMFGDKGDSLLKETALRIYNMEFREWPHIKFTGNRKFNK